MMPFSLNFFSLFSPTSKSLVFHFISPFFKTLTFQAFFFWRFSWGKPQFFFTPFLVKQAQWVLTLELLSQMVSCQVKADVITLDAAIATCASAEKWYFVDQLLWQLGDINIGTSTASYERTAWKAERREFFFWFPWTALGYLLSGVAEK